MGSLARSGIVGELEATGLRDRAADALAVAAIAAGFLCLLALSDRVARGSNPDQWFHFAISRMSQDGLVRSLPQAEDVGWARRFPEKEYLFHRITAIAYWAGGERAVLWACRGISVLGLLVLYVLARRVSAPLVAAASVGGLVVANPFLLFRMGMVRPHVLAILCFLLVLAALLYRSRLLAFGGGLAFALAYHAIYVPAALAVGFAAVAVYRRARGLEPGRDLLGASAAVVAGLAAGVLVNPYFPANVTMGLEHLRYAFSAAAAVPGVHVGAEVLPPPPALYLRDFGVSLLALGACIVWLRSDGEGDAARWTRAVITAAALFLVGAGLRSIRATEYGLPLLALAVAAALGDPLRRPRTRAIAIAALLVLPAWPLSANLRRKPDVRHERLVTDLFAAMRAVPASAAPAKVFNCDWNYGSFLLYARPDLRFVDLLDPRFLLSNPGLFEAKRLLDLDAIEDPVGVMRSLFKADYALCGDGELSRDVERDQRVRVLFAGSSGLRLYALSK